MNQNTQNLFTLEEVFLDSKATAHLIVDTAADKKAANILMLDVQAVTTLADYFVICEGNNDRQLKAIVDAIRDDLKSAEIPMYNHEGSPASGWILLDYGFVIVHIFLPQKRKYYNLEELWQEAPTVLKML